MKWMGLNEVREKFLSFFEGKGHSRLGSFPLVPIDDNSLLLINSGMAPLKKYFLGQAVPPNKRVTTCQKCIRTPDIERVGKTSRHGTYFEMLGNFSFGDYFKNEATAFAWEFITETMQLPVDRLWISIYQDDDETFDIWTKQIGIPADRIVRLGKEDNFWEIGSGPCGPCSEIYFDRGVEHGCDNPNCAVGCDCDRYVEFWNLVFSQFNSDGEGTYTPMEKPNIDTGMGLERLACILQGVDNLFEVDTVANIMKHICDIAKVEYKANDTTDVSLRVITDHIRSTVFMISDGVMPNNEGRGYVLRRLLRRAARHGRLLDIKRPFLFEVCDTVIKENQSAYPELVEKAGYIKKIIEQEEQRFAKTIDNGLSLLNDMIEKIEQNNSKTLSGEDAFKLYDTFGIPIELTEEILQEKDMQLDIKVFEKLMQQQRELARENRSKGQIISWSAEKIELNAPATVFTGYDQDQSEAVVQAIIADSEQIDCANAGDEVCIILDKTPFYTISGGQVSDKGTIYTESTNITVYDCNKYADKYTLHICKIEQGEIKVGDKVCVSLDKRRRQAIKKNHTAAHLLQAALRKVLGDHVHQCGSEVDENKVRFDFSHFNAMTKEELDKVEEIVNMAIVDAIDISHTEMPIDKAKELGAMALFSEKYGDVVRVCNVENFSVELCGGTHVDNTSKLGIFKIISESSVAAGVRRIEGTTSLGVLGLLNSANQTIMKTCETLKLSNPQELVAKTSSIINDMKKKDKEIQKLNQQMAESKIGDIGKNMKDIGGVKYITLSFTGINNDALRKIGDKIKSKSDDVVAIMSSIDNGKGSILAVCGKNAIAKGLHAGNLVKEVAVLAGGSGGGRPDSAMAGVKEIFKIDEALVQVPAIIQKFIK